MERGKLRSIGLNAFAVVDELESGTAKSSQGKLNRVMQSMFDERQWLAWLVKVRILILTLLLGIELAISRLTAQPVALAAVRQCHSALVCAVDFSSAAGFVLAGIPHPVRASGGHRFSAGDADRLCDRRR